MNDLVGYREPPDRSKGPAAVETQGFSRLLRRMFIGVAILFFGSTVGGLIGGRVISPSMFETSRKSEIVNSSNSSSVALWRSEVEALEHDLEFLQKEMAIGSAARESNRLLPSAYADVLSELLVHAQKRSLDSRTTVVAMQSAFANADLKAFRPREPSSVDLVGKAGSLESAKQNLIQSGKEEDTLRQLITSLKRDVSDRERWTLQAESIGSRLQVLRSTLPPVAESRSNTHEVLRERIEVHSVSPSMMKIDIVVAKHLISVVLGAFVGVIGCIAAFAGTRWLFRRPMDSAGFYEEPPRLADIPPLERLAGKGLDSVMTFVRPEGIEARPFRNLRSAITFSSKTTQRLLVTSGDLEDGKTTVAVNLALSFAQAHRNTLLIDADVRRAGTTQFLDLLGRRGLTQILRDLKPITESCLENVFNLGIENLDVLPAGLLSEEPTDLFRSDRLSAVIDWAKQSYDQILIDGPALELTQDCKILGSQSDCSLIVVRSDKNRHRKVRRAVEMCQSAGIRILGFVTNEHPDPRKTVFVTPPDPLTYGSSEPSDVSRRAAV